MAYFFAPMVVTTCCQVCPPLAVGPDPPDPECVTPAPPRLNVVPPLPLLGLFDCLVLLQAIAAKNMFPTNNPGVRRNPHDVNARRELLM